MRETPKNKQSVKFVLIIAPFLPTLNLPSNYSSFKHKKPIEQFINHFCRYLIVRMALYKLTFGCEYSNFTQLFLGYRSVIDEQGCDLVAVYVNKCSGYCLSLSFMNPLQQNELSVHARCCRMIGNRFFL